MKIYLQVNKKTHILVRYLTQNTKLKSLKPPVRECHVHKGFLTNKCCKIEGSLLDRGNPLFFTPCQDDFLIQKAK